MDALSLAQSILSESSFNNIPALLALLKDGNSPKTIHAAISATSFLFSKLNSAGLLDNANRSVVSGPASSTLSVWIKSQRSAFLKSLLSLLSHNDPKIHIISLEKHLLIVKEASDRLNEFQVNLFSPLILSILSMRPKPPQTILSKFITALNAHDDLRFYFYKVTAKLIKQHTAQSSDKKAAKKSTKKKNDNLDQLDTQNLTMSAIYAILSKLRPAPPQDSTITPFCSSSLTGTDNTKSNAVENHSAFKSTFSDCWIAFLSNKLPHAIYISILESIHENIIPNLSEPTLLMDFLVDAYNQPGITPILALHALFTLINSHNLDYPNFYDKLYTLFTPSLFHSPHRDQFLELSYLFLSSQYLPSYLVTKFLIQLARLCVSAPPSAIVAVVPIIFNLLQKHPSCISLIHSKDCSDGITTLDGTSTTFKPQTESTDSTDAETDNSSDLPTSLYPLLCLSHHYFSTIPSITSSFTGSLATSPFNISDFMGHSYASLVKDELNSRKRKRLSEITDETGNESIAPIASKANRTWLSNTLWREE